MDDDDREGVMAGAGDTSECDEVLAIGCGGDEEGEDDLGEIEGCGCGAVFMLASMEAMSFSSHTTPKNAS